LSHRSLLSGPRETIHESGMRENCTFRLSGGRRRALQWAPPPTRQAERVSLKARTLERRLDVEISSRPCGRKSRSLAFGAVGKGEAPDGAARRAEASTRKSTLEPLARTQNKPSVLNLANRRIRTRMYGGVGGEESRDSPLSRSRLRSWPVH
jgi:hypothetical protein